MKPKDKTTPQTTAAKRPQTDKEKQLETIIHRAKEFRREYEHAEARFFVFLVSVEREHANLLRECGYANFEQWVRTHNLCEAVHRYMLFRDGMNKCGAEMAIQNGVPWTIAIGKQRDPRNESALGDKVRAFISVHHTAPSADAVDDWVRALPRQQLASDVNQRRLTELERLRKENAELRHELVLARKRIAELEQTATKRAS